MARWLLLGLTVALALSCGRTDRRLPPGEQFSLRITPPMIPQGVLGVPYSARFSAEGSVGRVAWRLLSARPSWMELTMEGENNRFFRLSGTPDSIGEFDIEVQAFDSDFQSDKLLTSLVIVSDGAPLELTTQRLPTGVVGLSYNVVLAARGGIPPYEFSAEGLPSPLRIENGDVPRLIGVPDGPSLQSILLIVTDSEGAMDSRTLELDIREVAELFEIVELSFPNGRINEFYQARARANQDNVEYSIEGDLPRGLVADVDLGALIVDGVPLEIGVFPLTIVAQNPDGVVAVADVEISIRDAMPEPLSLSPTMVPDGEIGEAYSAQLQAIGGVEPMNWRIMQGNMLPDGLTATPDGRSFRIEGIATREGDFPFRVIVTDAQGAFAEVLYLIRIADIPVSITTDRLISAEVNLPYIMEIESENGRPPYTWSLSNGTLPAGLRLDSDGGPTARILGTPTMLESQSIGIQVFDANMATASKSFTLNVVPQGPPLQLASPAITADPCGPVMESLALSGGISETPIWSISEGQHGLRMAPSASTTTPVYGHYRPTSQPVVVSVRRGSQTASTALSITTTQSTEHPRYVVVLAGSVVGRNLFLVDVCGSGSPVSSLVTSELGAGNSVQWSPDGRKLAYLAGPPEYQQLYVVDVSGASPSPPRLVGQTAGPTRSIRSFVWSPNSEMIAFEGDHLIDNRFEAQSVVVTSTPTYSLLHSPVLGRGLVAGGLTWSPDSTKILLRGDFDTPNSTELFINDAHNGIVNFQQIVDAPSGGGSVFSGIKYHPSGDAIVYSADVTLRGRRDLYVMPFAGGVAQPAINLTSGMVSGGDVVPLAYDWSPVGNRGFFRADYRVDGRAELFTWQGVNPMAPVGPDPILVAGEGALRALWSNQGRLALAVGDPNLIGERLHILEPSSPSGPLVSRQVVLSGRSGISPQWSWSPDGQTLGIIERTTGGQNAALVTSNSVEFLRGARGGNIENMWFAGSGADLQIFAVGEASSGFNTELFVVPASEFATRRFLRRISGALGGGNNRVVSRTSDQIAIRPTGKGVIYMAQISGVNIALVDDHFGALRTPAVELATNGLYVRSMLLQPRP